MSQNVLERLESGLARVEDELQQLKRRIHMVDVNVQAVTDGLAQLQTDVTSALAALATALQNLQVGIDTEDLVAIKADKVVLDALHAQITTALTPPTPPVPPATPPAA